MDANKILISVFGIIGVLFLIIILYYLYRRAYNKHKTLDFPPNDYMKYVGAQCPDYWELVGREGNNVICQNKFNIPLKSNNTEKCKFVPCDRNPMSFMAINNWPLNKNNARIRQRCLWRECCTTNGSTPASWIGLEGSC